MKKRVNAGSDMAAIGAWDASLGDSVLRGVRGNEHIQAVERDAKEGLLFLIRIGADWGGPIDVYVDEDPPKDATKDLKQLKGTFLLSAATGRLVIDGLEFYRTGKGSGAVSDNALEIPAGDYALRLYESESEGGIDPPQPKDLAKVVGARDSKFYQSVQWLIPAVYVLVPISFFVIKHFAGWKLALMIAATIAAAGWAIVSIMGSGQRFKRAAKANEELWRQAEERQQPVFVFASRKINEGEKLTGGWVDLRK